MEVFKIVLYIVITPLVLYGVDSININNIFKKNKYYQSRVLYIMIVISLSYLVVNYIYDFLTISF